MRPTLGLRRANSDAPITRTAVVSSRRTRVSRDVSRLIGRRGAFRSVKGGPRCGTDDFAMDRPSGDRAVSRQPWDRSEAPETAVMSSHSERTMGRRGEVELAFGVARRDGVDFEPGRDSAVWEEKK